ncbi:sprT domain-containing protein [Brevibacillus laterosporus]|nr:SprT-like domain-containing protein [Brevibacillus laterosporus]TPG71491.1 sprT domain-containing protein [Brevibacillus laterosporus]TPG93017.1 sprT domain-containing protein [Brevibacillus laterosporus]
MNSKQKPTALMLKYLYAHLFVVDPTRELMLEKLSYQDVYELIQQIKRFTKEKQQSLSSSTSFQEHVIWRIDTSSSEELYQIGNQLSLQYFGRPCKVPIEWDKSVKDAAGRFIFERTHQKPIKIVQSLWQYTQFGAQHVIATLKHELVHYHLCLQKKPFADGTPEFVAECRRIGAPLFAVKMLEGYQTYCSVCSAKAEVLKKPRKKDKSPCCKADLVFKEYIIRLPDGRIVQVEV